MIKKNLEESSLPVSRSNLGQVLFVIPVVVVVMQMMDLVDLKNWQDLKKQIFIPPPPHHLWRDGFDRAPELLEILLGKNWLDHPPIKVLHHASELF